MPTSDTDEVIVQLTQKDNDALREMYSNYRQEQLGERASNVGGRIEKGDELIAKITSTDDVELGYYKVDLYQHDPLLFDPTVRMTAAKLGTSDRSKVGSGYGYSWDELTNSEPLLDVGQIFECRVRGAYDGDDGDGLPIVQLIGNPIGSGCDGDE